MRGIRWMFIVLVASTASCGDDVTEPSHPSLPVGAYSYDIDEHVATGGWGPESAFPPFPYGHLEVHQATADSLVVRWEVDPAGSYPDTLQIARFVDDKYRVSMSIPSGWDVEHRFWLEAGAVRCEAVFTSPSLDLFTLCIMAPVEA
jgi:hypothetical protein